MCGSGGSPHKQTGTKATYQMQQKKRNKSAPRSEQQAHTTQYFRSNILLVI